MSAGVAVSPDGPSRTARLPWTLVGITIASVLVTVPLSLGGETIVEVWESQEDADRFVAERLAPALEAVGVTGRAQPQVWPVHGYIT